MGDDPCSYRYFFTGSVDPTCTQTYRWEVFDEEGTLLAVLDSTSEVFFYSWPYESVFTVRLTVIQSCGGTCTIEKEYFDEDCFLPRISGGGAPALDQTTQRQEEQECKVKIVRVYFEDTVPPPTIEVRILGGAMIE